MKISEVVDIRYSIADKLSKMHKVGPVYGKKDLNVPHATYVDKTKKKKKT